MKKKLGLLPYPGGRVSRQSQRVRGLMQPFSVLRKYNSIFWKKYLHTMMLKLTEHVGIAIFLLYKQKSGWNFDIQNVYSKILNFRLFFAKKKSQFSGPACFYDRHNYVTPWSIVLILVCMNREGSYLPIDTKINFIGVRFGKSREGVALG